MDSKRNQAVKTAWVGFPPRSEETRLLTFPCFSGDEFPTWTSYLMKVEFDNLNKFSDSPLCKAFYGLFEHSYVLEAQSDIEEAKKVLGAMVKFFTSPFPESVDDEEYEDTPLELAS